MLRCPERHILRALQHLRSESSAFSILNIPNDVIPSHALSHRVNAVIHDWLLKNIQDPPPIPESAISPWAERLGDYEKTSSDDGSSSD